jgi:hypothetical protein
MDTRSVFVLRLKLDICNLKERKMEGDSIWPVDFTPFAMSCSLSGGRGDEGT